MPKAFVDFKIEAKRFNKTLYKLKKVKNVPLNEELKELTQLYVQSVTKATPPKKGQAPGQPSLGKRGKTLASMATAKKRAVIDTTYPDEYRYQVPFRTFKKKGRQYFKTKREANKFATIRYRNIGKWGWISAGTKALGEGIKVKRPYASKWLKAITGRLGSARKWLPKGLYDKPFIFLTNRVYSIARYGLYSATSALRKVNNRMDSARTRRKIKKNYSKLWKRLRAI